MRRAAAVAARRCKNARCARVFGPRGALACLFEPDPSPKLRKFVAKLAGPEPPEFYQLARAGSRGFTRLRGTSPFALRFSGPHESPDTPAPTACRPHRGLQQTTKRRHNQPCSQRSVIIISFFCVSCAECRPSDLFYDLQSRARTRAMRQQKTKHVPSNAPTSASQNTHQSLVREIRAQGARPVAVFGAPLNPPYACTALCA